MKLTLMLADAAESVNGKLYILGGGWKFIESKNVKMAIAILIEVPWDKANVKHKLKLDLITEDGQPVKVNNQSFEINADFEVGRPPGSQQGESLNVPLAVNINISILRPGTYYAWHCSIDGDTDETWQVGFRTRPEKKA